MPLLLALTACLEVEPTDSADTADTATTTPVSLDAEVPATVDAAWGCRWLYAAAETDGFAATFDLELPPADELTRGPLQYDRALAAGESFVIGGMEPGTGDLAVFDCSDVIETAQGVRVWTATAATLSITATYIEDRPEWTCSGTDDNPVYDLDITVSDVTFTDEDGVPGTLSAWGPLRVRASDSCGG